MIPKVIHYCWFGGNPLPELAKKCISSWKKYCPDYEIIEWNESNFDFSDCQYAKDAYESKAYAFVSDYARFKILYENGGIYFDTDVELINSVDGIVKKGGFLGCEPSDDNYLIASGLGSAFEKNDPICEEIFQSFLSDTYFKDDVMKNETIVIRVTNILTKYGFNSEINAIQNIAGVYIYPVEFFCPKNIVTGNFEITKNTVSIHHYDGSWVPNEKKYIHKLNICLNNFLPKRIAHWLSLIIGFTKYRGFFKMPKSMIEFKINNMKNR